jgi:phosphatidylserine/phosphatidylglycerophosphate/cardiolipin synthase-like enzyme
MLHLSLTHCNLFLGTNAGNEIYNDILQAQSSVLVVSPSVSEESIDLLLQKHAEGVNVMLITSTDFEGKSDSRGIYKKLITQARDINESKKRYRLLGLVLLYLAVAASVVSAVVGTFLHNFALLWPLFACPVVFLLIALLNKLRIYSYQYIANMPFHVIASPYADVNTMHQVFINTNMYVIDDRVAYLGSASFTRAGFYEHYENMFKITDIGVVHYIYSEINKLISDQSRLFRDINFIGKRIYPEPIN